MTRSFCVSELVLVLTMAILLAACGKEGAGDKVGSAASAPPEVAFEDVAPGSGLDFVHNAGATGQYYFPEIMGAGGAMFDYDNDGDLDVLLIQGGALGEAGMPESLPNGLSYSLFKKGHRLFRNELDQGGGLRFTDVSDAAGLVTEHYGMGVAIGDVDGDADLDLYITGFGDNYLFRNNGNGTFSDITAASGANDPRWSTSATLFDMDHDGDLDLYVANYVRFTLGNNVRCTLIAGQRDYCTPDAFPAHRDSLFRNEGLGRFSDVSTASGIGAKAGPGLGVLAADFNADGHNDLYVANDKKANFYWLNDGKGKFTEAALMAGAAYNRAGTAEASMGVTAADFDGDGDEDLFMTHLSAETNTLYLNDGAGQFEDATDRFGLGGDSLPFTGFGSAFFDANNDGLLDLFVANGAVLAETAQAGSDWPYRQTNQLFVNTGSRFADMSTRSGDAMQVMETGRGAAFGDVDNDGDIDVLVTNNNGLARLLLNENGSESPWLRVRLVGGAAARDPVGAKVALLDVNGSASWRRAHRDGSYLSASDLRVHFGFAGRNDIKAVGVEWPDGRRERWTLEETNKEITLVEGSGVVWPRD